MDSQDTTSCGIIAAFTQLLDTLYWEGYTQGLAEADPALYLFEFEQFVHIFNG